MDNRTVPHDSNAEMSVLGAVFVDNESIRKANKLIDAMDFYQERHRIIFKHMLSLALSSTPIDFVTVSNALKEESELKTVGGAPYLLNLVDFVPQAGNVLHYCKIVKEEANKRRLIQYGQSLVALGHSGSSIIEGVKEAKAELSALAASMDSFGGVSVGDITTIEQRSERYAKQVKTFDRSRFITGFPLLDSHIRGVAPGEVLTIIAEPGGFKTAWLQNILLSGAARTGLYHLFFSMEMPDVKVFEREAQIANGIAGREVERAFKESGIDAKAIQTAIYSKGSRGLLVCDKPRLDLDKITRYIELAGNKYGKINAVGIDYLGLLAGPGRTLFEKTAHNAPEIKNIAKEANIPIIVLCQINREGSKSKHDIEITDAKGGGDIEASADIMLGFYSDEDGNLICKGLKNRNGAKGFRLLCDIDRASFQFIGMSEYEKKEPKPAYRKAVGDTPAGTAKTGTGVTK
jgi:replicative DNA helicase